jgi:hypothetical protein
MWSRPTRLSDSSERRNSSSVVQKSASSLLVKGSSAPSPPETVPYRIASCGGGRAGAMSDGGGADGRVEEAQDYAAASRRNGTRG